MKLLAERVGLVVFVLACAHAAAAQQQQAEQKVEELPNFHRVNERIYRGAQPAKGGMQKLAALGVKTVINLRDDDERAVAEAKEAEAAGLRYVNVPLDDF